MPIPREKIDIQEYLSLLVKNVHDFNENKKK
jgi:hypothetical protein